MVCRNSFFFIIENTVNLLNFIVKGLERKIERVVM
jgi:hypothetical protein